MIWNKLNNIIMLASKIGIGYVIIWLSIKIMLLLFITPFTTFVYYFLVDTPPFSLYGKSYQLIGYD
jgi:hypothetical protein